MKKITLIALLFLSSLGQGLWAQNVANNVVASGGGNVQLGNGLQFSFTVGEPIIITASTGNIQLTQGFHQSNGISVLPVAYTAFSAITVRDAHQLKWVTSREINNDYFLIERSSNNEVFSPVKIITSEAVDGNSNSEIHYSYTNYDIQLGVNYYRLKQFDKNGKWTYSKVLALEAKQLNGHALQLFPNPVVEDATLQIIGDIGSNAKVHLVDMSGKTWSVTEIRAHVSKLSMTSLPSGSYLLRYSNGTIQKTLKFIKR